MAPLVSAVVALCFIASLIPFIYPDTVMNVLGVYLNLAIGEFLATTLKLGKSSLVEGTSMGHTLTLDGVLTVYVPMLVILLFFWRR